MKTAENNTIGTDKKHHYFRKNNNGGINFKVRSEDK